MVKSFEQFELIEPLLKALTVLGYESPTDVQSLVIPAIKNNRDVIIKSKTGSGKTAAFAIPVLNKIIWDKKEPQVLVLTPTRELATQVRDDIFNIGRFLRIKVEAVHGKSSFDKQAKQLKQRTHVVVATPGRLIDHILSKTIDLTAITHLVIDEADEMLKMGFIDQVKEVLTHVPMNTQMILLSATMPQDIVELSNLHMVNPQLIVAKDSIETENKLLQYYYEVEKMGKIDLISSVLIVENPNSAIIFCNTKQSVDEVYQILNRKSFSPIKLHGDMDQKDRLKVINDFKHGLYRYLVATDVAARGLDIDQVSLIINFDLPRNIDNYIHRIGRSARAGASGKAISFISNREYKYLDIITAQTNQKIEELEIPTELDVKQALEAFNHKQEETKQIKMDKGFEFKQEIMKLHINAGKKTKMRPSDIVGAICNIKELTAADIGVITILDISTFVEILNNKGEIVYQALQKTPIKGRMRVVSKANKTEYELAYEETTHTK
ncbi:MAG: DEAD/DEAH box helicase [Paracholeplasma sp.]|nr:DEAD/DEAH box helicase [Paracholeplasma sp.]MDY3196241.1 DEAD/DEAH box helicase [Paracholeplasma sp.]